MSTPKEMLQQVRVILNSPTYTKEEIAYAAGRWLTLIESKLDDLEKHSTDMSWRLENNRQELERYYYMEGRPGYGEMGG